VTNVYEAYPQNKLRLQIFPLQRCGHYGAHACRVCWSFLKAETPFADNLTTFTHCPARLKFSWKSRSPLHVNAVCKPFLECRKHETGWHSSSTLWCVWRTWHEEFNSKEMGETLMKDAKMCMMVRGAADRLWHTSSSIKKKFKQIISTRKIMCTMFFVLLVLFLPQGSTINEGVYCDTFKRLRRAIQKSDVACLIGVVWCFMKMSAHILPPQRKISSRHLAANNSIIPLQPRLSAKGLSCAPVSENFPWWPVVPQRQRGQRSL
jgi:hypothetical protein